jgi:PAS domain-containing protein
LCPTAPSKQIAVNVLYLGSGFLPPLWWLLTVRFSEIFEVEARWVRPWMKTAPLVVAAVFWALALTNPWHGQFITPVAGGRNVHHRMFSASVMVLGFECVMIMALNSRMCLRAENSPTVRRTAATMLVGSVVVISSLAGQAILDVTWPIDLTVIGCSVTVFLCVAGIYRLQLFHLLPVTLREVFENDPEGVVLIDARGRLRFANQQAEKLLPTVPFTPDGELLVHLTPLLSRTDGGESPVTLAEFWQEVIEGPRWGKLYYDDSSSPRCLQFTASRIGATMPRSEPVCHIRTYRRC